MMRACFRSVEVAFLLLSIGAAALQAQTADRVVLVIIDGARYTETLGDPAGIFAPRMKQLALNAAVVDTFINNNFTYTQRAIPAIWTGSWSAPVDTTIGTQPKNQYCSTPTVWEYFRKEKGGDSTTAIYFTKYLTTPWMPSFSSGYGPAVWPWYISAGNTDREVWEIAHSVMSSQHPILSVMYLADVDHNGHSGVWADYTSAISIADSIVGEVWDALGADPFYAGRTALFVTNDHGRHDALHGDFQSHGDGCWGCRHIMLLGAGCGIRPGHSPVLRTIPDIVPTIGNILGFPTPQSSGHVMTELLLPATSVRTALAEPFTLSLEQNFPNPFNPATSIRYHLASSGQVTLRIHDLLGRTAATLVERFEDAGPHAVIWDASRAPSGMYVYELQTAAGTIAKKMLLVR